MSKYNQPQVIDFLNEKWKGKGCPMCGRRSLSLSENIFEIREFNDGNFVVGGQIIPLIPITCSNCGHTIFVNAIVVGAVERNNGEKENGK